MTPSPLSNAHGANEINRIRGEYLRRAREIPSDFYGWQRGVNRYFHSQVYRYTIEALLREGLYPLDELTVADMGCGYGSWLLEFCQWGAKPCNLAGIDLDENRVESARKKLPAIDLRAGDARITGWSSSTFDVVSQFGMFTSVLDPEVKNDIAKEMLRIVRPSGVILWFDFRYNNPMNSNVRGIGAKEIRQLFPGCAIRLQSVLLAPPIARRIVDISWMLALTLEKLPMLRSHYLGIIRKQ